MSFYKLVKRLKPDAPGNKKEIRHYPYALTFGDADAVLGLQWGSPIKGHNESGCALSGV